MKPDTYDEVVAQRDAARAAVKAWEDKEASRGMCCWQMEQERNAARAEVDDLRAAVLAYVEADKRDAWTTAEVVSLAKAHADDSQTVDKFEESRDAAREREEELRVLVQARDAECDAARAEAEAERIENAHLREAFVVMERAANDRETELTALRERHAEDVEHAFAAGVTFTATCTDQMSAGLRKWPEYKAKWARREP